MVTMLDNKWYTIDEAAEEIGCTPSYVRYLLRESHVDGKKIGPRMWLVDMKSAKTYAKTPKKTGRPRISEKKR